MSAPDIALHSARGRWVLLTAVLGSGVAFLDGTVVNAALPAIASDFDVGLSALQWVLTSYLLTLGSLLVLGGSLGDLYGRRKVFVGGLVGFAVASLGCAVAPNEVTLIIARAVQGVAAAALVPGSLALISASFRPEDRGAAIGAWSGLAGVSTAIGPFLGGWLIDAVSWRLVFLINVPLAAIAGAIAIRHVPETRDDEAGGHVDIPGAVALSVGLAGVVYALIEGPAGAAGAVVVAAAVLGGAGLIAFLVIERRSREPMVPLDVFQSRQFTGANLVTFALYAALGVTTFLVVVNLQTNLGYDALEAGAALLPLTVVMLLLSARAGAVAQRIGPRLPMALGSSVVAAGLLLLSLIEPGDGYVTGVLPAMVVLGLGLSMAVAPLTAAVLAAVEDRHAGVGSAINNAVARVASLLAIALLPAVVGLNDDFADGYRRALVVAAGLAVVAAVVATLTIERLARVRPSTQHAVGPPCADPCVRLEEPSEAAA